MNLVTNNYLDCSTAHITENDVKELEISAKQSDPISYATNYGFHVMIRSGFEPTDRFSKAFKKIYNLCLEQNISLIVFDCDADKIEGLETFNW